MKTPHVVALPFIYGVECIQFHTLLATLKNVFWPNDLDLWPMTLTFELDQDILPLDLHTEIQVCMSFRLAVRVVTHRHTDRQTHRRCQNYYTQHVTDVGPNTSQTWGVIINIIPIPKSSDLSLGTNYRGISLSSLVSKFKQHQNSSGWVGQKKWLVQIERST